jgi:hypothetical protein
MRRRFQKKAANCNAYCKSPKVLRQWCRIKGRSLGKKAAVLRGKPQPAPQHRRLKSSARDLGAHFGLLWVIRVVPEKALLDA